jgi:hypothetical protein
MPSIALQNWTVERVRQTSGNTGCVHQVASDVPRQSSLGAQAGHGQSESWQHRFRIQPLRNFVLAGRALRLDEKPCTPAGVGGVEPQLSEVQDWRKACNGLARSFDNVLRVHLYGDTGIAPL